MPPGSLVEPMFAAQRPDSVNYGKLGVYMASRMFHTIDRYGKPVRQPPLLGIFVKVT